MEPSLIQPADKALETCQSAVVELRQRLAELRCYEADRVGGLRALYSALDGHQAALERLETTIKDLQQLGDLSVVFRPFLEELACLERLYPPRFGAALDKELRSRGMKLNGRHPDYRVGLFTITLNLRRGTVKYWYGPKHEALGEGPPGPTDVADRLQILPAQISCGLPSEEFFRKLIAIYDCLPKDAPCARVGINAVREALGEELRASGALKLAQRRSRRRYGLAGFSYDLYRLQREHHLTLDGRRLQLTAATLLQTKKPGKDHLWIPDSDAGSGRRYAYLAIGEVDGR